MGSIHAIARAAERYGVEFKDIDLHNIQTKIRNGEAGLVHRQGLERWCYDVEYQGQIFRVGVIGVHKTISTFLEREDLLRVPRTDATSNKSRKSRPQFKTYNGGRPKRKHRRKR